MGRIFLSAGHSMSQGGATSLEGTTEASEMIRINFSDRSSRVTGPKIRVPMG